MRERRPGVGGRGGRAADTAGHGRRQRGQEGRAAAESHAVDGAHGRAAAAAVPGGQRSAALRHGAAPRRAQPAARRVTPPRRTTPLPYHAYIPLSGRSDSPECTRVSEYYRLGIYLFGTGRGPGGRGAGLAPRGAHSVICATGRVVTVRTLRPRSTARRSARQRGGPGRRGRERRRHAESVASLDTLIGLDVEVIVSIEIWKKTRFHCPLVVL